MNKLPLITSALGITLLLGTALPAFAADANVQTSVTVTANTGDTNASGDATTHVSVLDRLSGNASTSVRAERDASNTQNRIENAQNRADNEIDARINNLNKLIERLGGMKLLSSTDLATLQASLNAEIQVLTNLKAQIAADTSTTSVKADASTIAKAYRVYLLVIPQAQIAAASDRINAVVTKLQAFGAKLQTRITAAQGAGVNVSAAVTAMADFNAKIADAKTQADAAVAETVNLKPDNGDKTVLASNKAALKDARTKLKTAGQDFAAARHDAAIIVGIVKGHGEVHATTTASST